MKTKNREILLSLVLALITTLSSCTVPISDVDPATIPIKMTVISQPNKLEYELNEQFDSTGLRVESLYIDGSKKNEVIDNSNISGFDSSSVGVKTITVAKHGQSAAFTVTVRDLVSLSISSWPDKLTYELYESPDWSGLEVMKTYSDHSSSVETNYHNYDISGFDSSSPGEQTITVSKNGLSAAFAVTVNPPLNPETVLVSLFISTLPNKLVYELYENADWTGLEVIGTYSNDSARVETSYDISGFDSSNPGEQTITVSKNDLNAAFTITVNPPLNPEAVLVSLAISSPPYKLVYELYEGSDWAGLEVRENYSDDSSRIETDYYNYGISGFDSSSPGEQTITVTKNSLSATFAVTVRNLVSLSISSLPNKLIYELGENSDWSGLEVTGTYSDGSARVETSYDISGFDSSSPGEQTITVSKNSLSAAFTVTVRDLVSLSISSLPNKLVYELGESSDWTGLEVTGTYSDGSARIETSYNIDSFYFTDIGEQSITVSKNSVSVTFTVTVRGLVSLSISSLPNKLVYGRGESSDWTGLEVTGTYSDGSARVETSYDISGFNSSSTGEQTITVTKDGISTTFTVNVNPPLNPETILVSLSISSLPNKLVYELGESAGWTGLEVTGTYSDGSSRIEPSYDISGFDASSIGEQTITVSKNGVSATFTVNVRGLVSLSVSSLPNKLVYELGENSDWTGLKVTGTYSDGSARVETSYDISGFDARSASEQTITVSKNSISAAFAVTVRGLVSLSISSLPHKLVYEQNESADWTGLEVTGTYSDGSSRLETSYDIGYISNWGAGEQTITVTKDSVSATFTVTVIRIDSLSISSEPNKKAYEPGDNPDWTGLVVEGTYFDGSNTWNEIIDHDNYDISGFDSSSPGVKYIYVSKNGVSAWFTVTVEGLSSLSISSEPNKKVYKLGESPDWTGLMVVGHYFIKDPQIETIDYNSEISGFDSSSPGIKTITVTKSGVSASFTVEVLPGSGGAITILPPFHAADIALTLTDATVTAPGGYTDYQWFVDDMPRLADSGSDGKAITLSAPEYASGTYRVWVIAHKQGLPYSGETYITLP